jgi:hypothetical protein
MKNETKGIAPLIIAVVVVVVVAVAGVGTYVVVTRGGGGPGGTSVYPGAQEYTEMTIEQLAGMVGQEVPTGWSGKIYNTSDSVSSVMSWYRTQMAGWTKVYDNTIEYMDISFGILEYTSGNDATIVWAEEATGVGTIIVVMSGPASGLETG